jgi:hypothetical protein
VDVEDGRPGSPSGHTLLHDFVGLLGQVRVRLLTVDPPVKAQVMMTVSFVPVFI